MKYILFIVLFLVSSLSFSQNLQFFKEKLNFNITKTDFTVDGLYYFRNTTTDTIKQYLSYPFSQISGLEDVISVEANSVYPEMKAPALVNFDQKAARFRLKVLPFDTAVVRISYVQSIPNNKAEYILTSTKAWDKPLEKAYFTLKLPINHKVDSLSYDADSLLIRDGYLLYKFYFKDFMPKRNFYVSFSRIE
jgi:hypothetical protein